MSNSMLSPENRAKLESVKARQARRNKRNELRNDVFSNFFSDFMGIFSRKNTSANHFVSSDYITLGEELEQEGKKTVDNWQKKGWSKKQTAGLAIVATAVTGALIYMLTRKKK